MYVATFCCYFQYHHHVKPAKLLQGLPYTDLAAAAKPLLVVSCKSIVFAYVLQDDDFHVFRYLSLRFSCGTLQVGQL